MHKITLTPYERPPTPSSGKMVPTVRTRSIERKVSVSEPHSPNSLGQDFP